MLNLLVKECAQLREGKRRRDAVNEAPINVDDILHRVQLSPVKANIDRVKITQEQFIQLCRRVKKDSLSQPALLRIDGPIHVCTGTLGNYKQLSNIFDRCGHPKFMNYLLLGDYSGRYEQSLECIIAIFAYKLFAPYNFFMLRGCHQTLARVRASKLQEHLSDYFGSSTPWLEVCQTFCSLPYAAIIDQKVFCVHGGISPFMKSLQQINQIPRPLDASNKQIACDLLFSDPTNLYKGWTENQRGISVSFGSDVVAGFLKTHDLSLICRGHQVPYQGFRYFGDRKLVTICSLHQYSQQLNNAAAVMMIDQNGNVLFKMISERNKYTGQQNQEALTFLDLVQRKREKDKKVLEVKGRMKEDEQRRKQETIAKNNRAHKYKSLY